MTDSLGDRMKGYENISRHSLMRRTPVIVRVDGRAFHTYTARLHRPFDRIVISTMVGAASGVMRDMQGCKLAYVQSDEASFLLTDWENLETQAWFGYNIQKVVSIAASSMTARFNIGIKLPDTPPFAMFDARAFNIPKEEVANYFLWRAKDWERNSIQMVARSVFSQKELDGFDRDQMKTMLLEKGVDWDKYLDDEKYGTFLVRNGEAWSIAPSFSTINVLAEEAMR